MAVSGGTDGTAPGTKRLDPTLTGSVVNLLGAIGSEVYFVSRDFSGGTFLEKTDGTDAGTIQVADLWAYPGENGTFGDATAVGSTLYFLYHDWSYGSETLWKSDGTSEGTGRVTSLNSDLSGSWPSYLTAVGPNLYFTTGGGTIPGELYKTDGTAAGTVAIHDLKSPLPPYIPILDDLQQTLPTIGDKIYFTDSGPTGEPELWETDGTTTTLVKTVVPDGEIAAPDQFYVAGRFLYFNSSLPDGSNGLFRSDGTDAGTSLLKTFDPGWTASSGASPLDGSAEYQLNRNVLFLANDGIHGKQLWKTDGTAEGTSRITDFQTPLGFNPISPVILGGYLYFGLAGAATTGQSGLWRTDGTEAGTTLVKGFAPTYSYSSADTSIQDLTLFDGAIYFAAREGDSDFNLWRSDGTTAGTYQVMDVPNGSSGSYPTNLTVAGSNLFFTASVAEADNYAFGPALWKTDGTPEGTVIVKDFYQPTTNPPIYYTSPANLTAVGSTLFFTASDGIIGGLYKSDGTAAGTVLVEDPNPEPHVPSASFPLWPSNLTAVGSTLFFTTEKTPDYHDSEQSVYSLWKSDGDYRGGPRSSRNFPRFLPTTTMRTRLLSAPCRPSARRSSSSLSTPRTAASRGSATGLPKER